MELKLDKTAKILLGAIALGLFFNVSNIFIKNAYATYYYGNTNITDLNVEDLKEIIRGECG